MFTRILTSALFAGFAAGLIAALLHFVFVQPVLLHAELYETGAIVHFKTGQSTAQTPPLSFDLLRDGMTILFYALLYTGYGLMMVAGMAFASERGIMISARIGIVWGIAGFVAVQLVPAIGLPPEVPGSAAADVATRQMWWFPTVAATGIALALIAFGRCPKAWVAAVALLLLPHIIGAPQPDEFYGAAPPELSGLFVARSLGIGLASWVLLGLLAGYFWQRENKS